MVYSTMMVIYSLYLHIPFCQHRCGYCDFNTYAGLDALIEPYVQALCREAEIAAQAAGERLPAHTVFFGGGTPSLLPAAQLEKVLATLQRSFDLLPGVEITLEANPGTLSLAYLRDLHRLGVNRLSLGMQSAHPGELRLLERQHGYSDVVQAVQWARQAGFTNLNLDLIFGLPHQPLETWQQTVELASGLHPEHLALYALTLEHGTPLAHLANRGLIAEPDPDLAADMYEWASQRLAEAGYIQYEISNWARCRQDKLLACRHNLQYWRNLPYLGLGAGAHGFAGGVRTANVLAPGAYIRRLQSGRPAVAELPEFPHTPATQELFPVEREAEIAETMMMGLRLTQEGVSAAAFRQRFGQDLQDFFARPIARLRERGLLEWSGAQGDRLRLTAAGRLLGNQVFVEFI